MPTSRKKSYVAKNKQVKRDIAPLAAIWPRFAMGKFAPALPKPRNLYRTLRREIARENHPITQVELQRGLNAYIQRYEYQAAMVEGGVVYDEVGRAVSLVPKDLQEKGRDSIDRFEKKLLNAGNWEAVEKRRTFLANRRAQREAYKASLGPLPAYMQ